MKGLDTNLIVRLLTNDDPAQAALVARLVDEGDPDEHYFVNAIVVVEVAWTLGKAYRWERRWVLTAIEKLALHPRIELEDRDDVLEAVKASANGLGDFADLLIALRNRRKGCSMTLTFDKQASRFPEFSVLET